MKGIAFGIFMIVLGIIALVEGETVITGTDINAAYLFFALAIISIAYPIIMAKFSKPESEDSSPKNSSIESNHISNVIKQDSSVNVTKSNKGIKGHKCPQCDFVFTADFSAKEGWWCPNCRQARY